MLVISSKDLPICSALRPVDFESRNRSLGPAPDLSVARFPDCYRSEVGSSAFMINVQWDGNVSRGTLKDTFAGDLGGCLHP